MSSSSSSVMPSISSEFKRLWREDGAKGFYKGLTPRLIAIGPG